MARSKQAKHLGVCPASVVCCSMEWNRWPVEDIDSDFHTNILKEDKDSWALDLSMAVRDQRHLCNRVKMKALFPELVEPADEPEPPPSEEEEEEEGAVGGEPYSDKIKANGAGPHSDKPKANGRELYSDKAGANGGSDYHFGKNVPQEAMKKEESKPEEKTNVAGATSIDREKYNRYEMMFSMERGGCQQAEMEEQDDKKVKAASSKGQRSENTGVSSGSEPNMAADNPAKTGITQPGFAPWEKGVLERLGQEVSVQEYNMYIVHHGRMLISFGQIEACTPREKDFVYGSLEPIPVQSIISDYRPPTSYRGKRIHKKDYSKIPKTEDKSIDTSDLGVSEDDIQKMDEMYATLLCCAEKEVRGHKICETELIDGVCVDIATQTYSYPSAPFKHDTSLADITADNDIKLYVHTLSESISSRYDTTSCVFTFRCGHPFRRDEYGHHYKNAHADIQFSLEGWFEQRCPLAYLGCTHSQRNIHPFAQKSTVCYHQDLSTFSLKPEVCGSLSPVLQPGPSHAKQARCEVSLSSLPYEVLCHIAGYLDSFTLSQLALVSRLFRDVCSTHLQERGMVSLKWKKKSHSRGGSRWTSTTVWEYSNLFSKVNRWCLGDGPSMADHLKVCPFYEREIKTGRIAVMLKNE
ncbi:hypothetical protein ACEWY4_009847 [Coilia grayii]|uniref:F-box domain-containing protein n=1 Tax=Coilia grayii TaxID=363190 RepID=A0ABD1K7M0_9TELE